MKLDQIREIAKKMNIKSGARKKRDLVRAIQSAEGNRDCFDSGESGFCSQDQCLWREDCDK